MYRHLVAAYEHRMTSNIMLRGAGLQRAPYVASPYVAASRSRRSRLSLSVLSVLEKEEPSLAVPSSLSHLEELLPPSLAPAKPRSVPAKQLSCDQGVFYYSYGANLRLATMKRREVQVLSRAPAVVCDSSVKLVFKHRGGYSTLRQVQPGEQVKYTPYHEQVHGVLYQISKEDLQKLAKKEGGYQLIDIEVETYDGWRATAKTFVSGPLAQLHAEVVPTERYMKQLRDGAADNYLDPLYQAWLSSIETVPSVGLPPEYYDTPAKYIAYSFLVIVALLVAGFFVQQ